MVGGARSKPLPDWAGQALAGVGLIVLLAGLGIIGWQGWDYHRQSREVEKALAALNQALAEAPAAQPVPGDEIQRLRQELAKKFPAELDLAALEGEVRDQAKTKGVDLVAFEPLLFKPEPGYRVQTIRLRVLGPAGAMEELAKALDQRPGLHRAGVDHLGAQGEGFQQQLHWDWYLALPGSEGEDLCPEPKDPGQMVPLRKNLFLGLWPRLRDQRREAENLQERLRRERERVRDECRRQRELESLKARQAVAEELEQKLLQSEP